MPAPGLTTLAFMAIWLGRILFLEGKLDYRWCSNFHASGGEKPTRVMSIPYNGYGQIAVAINKVY